jgi:hypothetical protein
MPASDALDRFRHAARAYCALIDRVKPGQGLDELVRPLHASVADVYAAALALSPLPVGDEDSQVATRAHEDWKELDDRLRGVLGRADRYYAIWDLEVSRPESVVEGSLADDLADIYLDLREGLALDEAGETPSALFEWRLGLWSNWGLHAANAIRELQLLREREGWTE